MILERNGELHLDGILVTHTDYEAMPVVAAGLLFARALIVGGGRFVAAAAVCLHAEVTELEVVEPSLEIIEYGRKLGRLDKIDRIHPMRVEDLEGEEPAPYDSIFYDAYPAPTAAAKATGRLLKPQGRLIFWRGAAAPKDFEIPLEVIAMLPIRSPELYVCRRTG